jgi:aspartyl-tRNA(Asn)/glutamyl-tRNA(Gln) amidotransferase subunit B
VIGMEVHVQPRTRSKMFCGCAVGQLGDPPNSNVCEICLGMPGVLPVINKAAVEACLKTALALNCEIPRHTKFDRKNYMYPDLPKGYQISQYDLPMSKNGFLELDGRQVRIRRVHLEEDTGKLIHAGDKLHKARESFVDLNRAGVPLMEIVSEPDLRSANEARDYAVALRTLLRTIGASEAEMEKGQLRAEPNISIRRPGSDELGVKTELKNINSFRALHRAILYEVTRQTNVLESGGAVVQETRGWSEAEGRTFSQRTKEFAEDYRYFPEPDLPPLEIEAAWIEELRRDVDAASEQHPTRLRDELVSIYGLTAHDASILASEPPIAQLFKAVSHEFREFPNEMRARKLAANWIIGEVLPKFRKDGLGILTPENLGILIQMVDEIGEVTRDQGRLILGYTMQDGRNPQQIARDLGLFQERDTLVLDPSILEVISENAKVWGDYVAGKDAAGGVLVGKVRGKTGGAAKPEWVLKRLGEMREDQRRAK